MSGVSTFPFIPGGLTIQWRQDGAPIPGKTGSTDDLSLHRVNTGDVSDFNFDATDTGSVIDFIIDGSTFSNPVVLSNQQPTLAGATAVEDAFSRVPGRPSISWIFEDADGDPQFLYRVKIGTSAGASDIFDSGQVLSSDQSFTLPDTEPELTPGSLFHWTVEASDGEKNTPTDPDSTTDRVLVSAAGTATVNTAPTVSAVKIDGGTGSPTVESFSPTISWTYFDVDSQPQQSFRVEVSEDPSFSTSVWDSGDVSGPAGSVTFGFDGTSQTLEAHTLYHVRVTVSDTITESAPATESFTISNKPEITEAFVDDKFNPTNLVNRRPTFTWTASDPDGDEITGYELRVSDDDSNLGTDSFAGDIWNTGFVVTPEAFEATLDEESGAFPGCVFPKDLKFGTKYFFQVRVEDEFQSSDWFTGCFKLNDPPEAVDLKLLPDEPFGNDDLEAVWTFVDDDGESESQETEVRWFRNGTEVVSARGLRTLPSSLTGAFEEWKFTVRPHDGVSFGPLAESPSVIIANRAPVATSLAIEPVTPLTGDALEALFAVSDPDGDETTVGIMWFKDDEEVPELRNQLTVRPTMTSHGERWYFVATPNDGSTDGLPARSPSVTIGNTRPDVLSMSVNGRVLPTGMDDPNPVVSWTYLDADGQAQQAYQVVIGTKAFRTKGRNATPPDAFFCSNNDDGIVGVAGEGDIVSGNDVFDSGVVESPNRFFQYATEDFVPSVSLGAQDTVEFDGYVVDPNLSTIRLGTGEQSGSVFFDFPGATGTYEAELLASEDGRRSSYELLVDGVSIGKFTSQPNGATQHGFPAAKIPNGAKLSVRGAAVDDGARAPFEEIVFRPVTEFEVDADEFGSLNGYVSDGSGGIKLVGLAGTASLDFPFPSGRYNVELTYVTESDGSPSVSVSVNGDVIDSFAYQTGINTRTRFIQDVTINTGDTFKVSGSKGGAASARVKKVVFRPVQTVQTGTKLRDGIKYFVSVRVNDGSDWSDWHTTTFTMDGSAWVSSVENSTGWTIETRARVTNEGAATSPADTGDEDGESGQAACTEDTFQGVRFYDGTSFGWMRIKPDKVELLVDEPIEVELDGTVLHTYRITAKGSDIKLYVDNELKIDGTGRFVQPTSRKLLEFGDISGRQQTVGSEWESFRYSITGPFSPNSLVDYTLDEIQRFPNASIGRIKSYRDALYVSVDPNDPGQSSSVFRFEEGFEPEKRSVVALTRSMVTSVVVDPNRRKNLFDTSGKFVGTHRGLQYVLGSKPFPFDDRTLMVSDPGENGWTAETNCENQCTALSSGILTVDTRNEEGSKFHKFTQRKRGDPWVLNADNSRGWTVEARVKIADDGSGAATIDENASFVLGVTDQCDPANGASSKGFSTTEIPDDDGLNAPGILVNDGTFQEVVQVFATGLRLKYARLFAEHDFTDQFYSVRVIGKGTAIAVYVKGDNDRFFKRLIFAPDGLFVRSQPVGDQELPHLSVDGLGSMHAVFQDSRDTDWGIFYTKSLPEEVVARGSGIYSADFADFEKFVKARPGFALPSDDISNTLFTQNSLFSGGASFLSWGVVPGDFLFVFSKSSGISPRKFVVSGVDHETVLKVDTEEDLSKLYDGVEYVIMRGSETWLPPVKVSTQALDSNHPRILLTSDTDAFVAYDNASSGSTDIYLRKGTFDPFYMNWGTSIRLTNARFNSSAPDLTQFGNSLVVVWHDSRNDIDRSEIFASLVPLNEFGVLESYRNANITPGSARARNARVAVAGTRLYIAYEDDPDEDGSFDVFVTEVGSDLSAIQTVQVSSGDGGASSPTISTDGESVLIAFEDDALGAKEIFVSRISNASKESRSFSDAIRVTDSRGDSENPDLAMSSSGDVMLAFQDNRVRKEFPDLYVSRFDSNLGQWLSSGQSGLDAKIENYFTSASNPSIAVDGFGNIGFAWESASEGELKRITRATFNGVVTMDQTVAGYFPLDDNSPGDTVENKIREFRGSTSPPVQAVFLINQSSEMLSGDRSSDAKSVVGSTISALTESDEFNIISFNDSTSSFRSDMVPATAANKTAADAFLSSLSPSGGRNLNGAISEALSQGLSSDGTKTPIIVFVDTGSSDDGSDTAFDTANEGVGAAPLVFGVEGANRDVLLGIAGGELSATFRDDFGGLSESFTDLFTKFESIRNSETRFSLSFEPQANGTAFDGTNLYHVSPFDPGISQRNPETQGAFQLDANGKGFSIPVSLVNTTGAVDLWVKPFWPSTDITERVIFGNAGPGTTTPNTMVFGIRPATAGNDLFLRVVDELGQVHETFANNSGGDNAFSWDPGDTVHLRAIWDQNAVGVSSLRSVSFPTTSVGYACSEAGTAWRTSDGGETWEELDTNVTYELYSVDFLDASTGWISGEFGTVLRTTDGGDTWEAIDTGVQTDLNGVYFRSSLVGYAVGMEGVAIFSTDGGATWDAAETGVSADLRDVGLADDGSVVAVGGNGTILRSTDDGKNYDTVSSPAERPMRAVSRVHQGGSYSTYVVGDAGTVLKTTDGGASWSSISFDWGLGSRPNLHGVSHGPDSDFVYVVGQNGYIAGSSDGGSTFVSCETAVKDGNYRDIEANFGGSGDNSTIVAVGVGGTVMLSSDGGVVQRYSLTRSGNLCIFVDGVKVRQEREGDGPFSWDPSEGGDLVFGDYRANGTHTANAAFDELIVYREPPPFGGISRRRDMWIFQGDDATALVTEGSEKRVEWGDISPNVRTKSFWTRVDMFFCGAKEPVQVFAWDAQIGLVDDVINDMALDNSGRLWLATEHGISSFDINSANEDIERWLGGRPAISGPANRFINYTNIVDGLAADDVRTIAVDGNDNVWAGTRRGLMLLEIDEPSFVEGGEDPMDVQRALDESGREPGTPGAGTFGAGEIINAPNVKFRTFTTDDNLPSDNIISLSPVDGAMFIGTDRGLAVVNLEDEVLGESASDSDVDMSKISVFTVRDGLPSNRIQSVGQERRTGDIWIGTDRGLAKFSTDRSVKFDTTSGLLDIDVFSITVDDDDSKFVGTGFGITKIDGVNFSSIHPSDGVGFGAILDGDIDGAGVKWFATANGLVEVNDTCGPENRILKFGVDDGIIGQSGVRDFQRYIIQGGEVPGGSCNKALVSVAVNGNQLSDGFDINECFPWVVFDRPRASSDRVEVCIHRGWRKSHDFSFDPRNPETQSFVQTGTSRFLLYRKRFRSGTVTLGANFAKGAKNTATRMYTVFVTPLVGSGSPLSSVSSPSGATISTSAAKGETSAYSDIDEKFTLLASDMVGAQHIALPSGDATLIDEQYMQLELSEDAFVFVGYDSRAAALPGWLRDFEPVGAVSRVTDMETFVDATQEEKLFMSIGGSIGCVFDLLNDPDICDISDQIALDSFPPEGCATIVRLNTADEAVLSLSAEDAVTGVAGMQVSAFENFTEDGTSPVATVPFQPTFNLRLPVEATDPVSEVGNSAPPDDNPLDDQQFPDIEYAVVFEHNDQIILGTKNPGRAFLFDRSLQSVSFLFDTGENEISSMASFGSDLIIGTAPNGRVFRWDGDSLSQILLPANSSVNSIITFDNRVFFGTAPKGKIFTMDQFGNIQLFKDTNETSVDGFAIFAGNLFWITSNDQVAEGEVLSLTTRKGHRHTVAVPAGASKISGINATTSEVDGHSHQVVNGVVQDSEGHSHELNGSRSGKVFRLNLATNLSTIVHADRDSFITSIVSTSIEQEGLMFIGTFPNGKILRFVPSEGIFIKSFDTAKDRIGKLTTINGVVYAVAQDDIFFFDGRRWQFFSSNSKETLDVLELGSSDILIVRSDSLGTVSQVQSDGTTTPQEVCAFVRFVDAAGNQTAVRDADGNFVECFRPCITPDVNGLPSDGSGAEDGGDRQQGSVGDDLDGDGVTDNPLLTGTHRIVEVDDNARGVFTINGPEPFLSGNRVENEVGVYESEVFNGTTSLVQWESLSWTGTAPEGTSITISVRTANTSSEISDAVYGPEFTDPSDNDLTNLPGQFLQFRATLTVTESGVASPQLDKVDIRLRTSQATHYFTTNFSLPDELRRGILTQNGCVNPPATDVVFGISGKDSTDFSDYFVITPDKVFDVPPEHRTQDLRVGIKLISSPDQIPVVDEFALLFSLANDAKIRLNLDGHPGSTGGGQIVEGDTITVVTDSVQGHTHTITFDANITDEAGVNGQTSINAGHSHQIINGIIQQSAGHTHEFSID